MKSFFQYQCSYKRNKIEAHFQTKTTELIFKHWNKWTGLEPHFVFR